ncbi:outer membrane beta-barrel protein [Dyadobacter subterraneus]|uniref:Outer membrane beta-barrel protein n=1 Tax=Dyadobacter subterraneus TaxID=2773304 RepID=A0ABR9W816_9BACT|nr:porin family protein [Dyadobacter subterraneus]MBE9461553.1 outer membrane beta-barrel protein [Dyadobacter subterraneus]
MKNLSIIIITIFSLSINTYAQEVNKDSLQSLKDEKKNIEISKSINDRKTDLAKSQNDLIQKTQEVEKTAADAQKAADENKALAARLGKDPQNKKLASDASKAARRAERSAKKARNAADDQQKLTKDIASLQSKIAEDEAKLGVQTSVATTSIQPATTQRIDPQPVANGALQSPVPSNQQVMGNSGMPSPQVITQNINIDSLRTAQNAQGIAQKVVEATYKNYPQQNGQPSIIINNIIIPSDYERPKAAVNGPRPEMAQMSAQERDEYEDYKAWKKQRNADNLNRADQRRYTENREENFKNETQQLPSQNNKLTFKERFGKRTPRNSGLWVIPVVGVHASSFKADFSDGKADGRIGWNAGLDFRIHEKRFFIQPGVHYFSSSMRISSEDSLSNAPLLSGPRIQSLKVPLLLGLYLTKANKGFFKMNVKAGATGTYVLAVDKSDQRQFDRDNIEDFSYGLNAGIGLEFGLITLDISHEWGMSTLFKDSNNKNNVLRATIGLKL